VGHTVVVIELRGRVGCSGHAECIGEELLADHAAEDTVPEAAILLEGCTKL
jgi:hypothetical protein